MKKKLMMLVAMTAMVMVGAAPAMADDWDGDCWDDWTLFWVCEDDFGLFWFPGALEVELGDVESGDVSQDTTITNSGESSNQAAAVLNASNTGNVQNVQGFLQYGSEADDIEISGGSIGVSPSLDFSAEQTVDQSAVAVW